MTAPLDLHVARKRLPVILIGNALMRMAGGASGVLVGLFLGDLANRGARVDRAFVGMLGAVSFAAEVVGAVPMGLLSDLLAPRALMTDGALLGAIATQLFGMTGLRSPWKATRRISGAQASASTQPRRMTRP